MDWTTPIDIYCERTAVGLWNEPFNALSNIAFVLAAYWGYASARRLGRLNGRIWVAILLAGSIGLGSFLFHTFANHWSELADIIPIWSFVVWMILVIVWSMSGGSLIRAAFGAVKIFALVGLVFWFTSGVLLSGTGTSATRLGLNGSEQYAPALLALYIFAAITLVQRHPAGRWLGWAAVVFTISLVFRTVDLAVCTPLPIGTHFVWHSLNGLMIGLLLQALVRHLSSPRVDGAAHNRSH